MEIDHHAPLVAQAEIFILAEPEAVWKVHVDVSAWGRWHPGISKISASGPLGIGSTFRWRTGGVTITSTVQAFEPERRIGWTGTAIGARARHVWTLTPHGGGTRLTTQESMDGWLARLMKIVMPNMLERSLEAWLRHLKRRVESAHAAA